MAQTNSVKRIASHIISALVVCLWFAFAVWADVENDRKTAAKSLAQEVERAQFHKIYVADFLDPLGARTDRGCFFASSFSTNLAKVIHNVEVINRIQAQKQLNELHISAPDLGQPESLSRAAQAVGAEVVLLGSMSTSPADVSIVLSLRDVAGGKEVYSAKYHEQLKPALDNGFPATENANTHFYYFPGLDGVSVPKCIHCPDPAYTDEARRNKFQGSILMSVNVDEMGGIRDVRVVQDPGYGLAAEAIKFLGKWKMKPSQDPAGNAVVVRVAIEITFRMYFGPSSY